MSGDATLRGSEASRGVVDHDRDTGCAAAGFRIGAGRETSLTRLIAGQSLDERALRQRPLSATRYHAAEGFLHLLQIRDLGTHTVEMLCAEPMGIGAACVARVVGEAEKCPDVVEAETKLSRSANEAQPLQIRQAIEPMPAAVRAGERRTPAFS
jgi:hypothetical protein